METWIETERNAWLSFKRICKDFLGNQQSSGLSGCCAGPVDFVQSYGMQYESENTLFLEYYLNFFPTKSRRSQWRTRWKISPKFWLWKSGAKASGPQVCWQTMAGYWRGIYLKPIAGESHTPLHFRGKFLPLSLARKVLFYTNMVLCIFQTLPDREILYIYISEFSIKSTAEFTYWSSWAEKMLRLVVQCN